MFGCDVHISFSVCTSNATHLGFNGQLEGFGSSFPLMVPGTELTFTNLLTELFLLPLFLIFWRILSLTEER